MSMGIHYHRSGEAVAEVLERRIWRRCRGPQPPPLLLQILAFTLMTAVPASAAAAPPGEDSVASQPTKSLSSRPVLDQTLTVEQAVTVALRESPVIRGAVAEVDAAAGRLSAARAETRPTISANTFVSGGSIPNIVESPSLPVASMIMGLPRGVYIDQNLMVMYPLFTSGRLQSMTRQSAALRGASEAGLETQRQDVSLMVRVAYRQIQARDSLALVARARLRDSEERLRVDRERLNQQRIPAYYVRRGEAEVASAQQEVTNAERDVLTSIAQLKTVMGVSLSSRLDLTERLEYAPSADLISRLIGSGSDNPIPAVPRDAVAKTEIRPSTLGSPDELAALLRRAEEYRPELRATIERVSGARAGEATARAEYRPQINLFAMGDVSKSEGVRGSGGVTFGATASFPLYTGGADRARAQTASAERRLLEAEQERLSLQIAKEVSDAYLSLLAAEKNIKTSQTALAAAQSEYRAAGARYEAGRSIVTEVFDALATRVRSESEVIQALFQYNVAHDQLLRGVGARSGVGMRGGEDAKGR